MGAEGEVKYAVDLSWNMRSCYIALALHRKGIRCTVLERSESLRSSGVALTIMPDGWHALHQLTVASGSSSVEEYIIKPGLLKWLNSLQEL
ncbi:monooxygenase 2-like [Daucus carota subsp. sativus]|uniref:monooxygenase 2-like n=1 Tax=Daucus carota subsp. sativus TaxID=79200 RepID=UPI003083D17A